MSFCFNHNILIVGVQELCGNSFFCSDENNPFVYRIGGYDKEDRAARAYDLAALKYWGQTTTTNFPVNGVAILICLLLDKIMNCDI